MSTITYLDDVYLTSIYENSDNQFLETLVRVHTLNFVGTRLTCTIQADGSNPSNIYLNLNHGEHDLGGILGKVYRPQVDLQPQPVQSLNLRPQTISLNTGSFGLDSEHNDITLEYYKKAEKLKNYLESVTRQALFVNLIDLPNEPVLLQQIADLGFEVYFVTNMVYSEGQFTRRRDSGMACLINRQLLGYNLQVLNMSVSMHHGGFFNYNQAHRKYNSEDFLMKPMTMLLTCVNPATQEVFITASAYVAAFSTQNHRLDSIEDSVKILVEMQQALMEKMPGYKVITRFTGDFNSYGYDSLVSPMGKWLLVHLPMVISGLISGFRPQLILKGKLFAPGQNWPNQQELKLLRERLRKHNFDYQTDLANQNQISIEFDIASLGPAPIRPLFKGAKVGAVLDLCITPTQAGKIHTRQDMEPFGNLDHKTVVVDL